MFKRVLQKPLDPRLLVGCAVTALMSHPAYAQDSNIGAPSDPSQSRQGMENSTYDIIVTAQKRSDRLRDVPISISAATGDQLSKMGVKSSDDLEKIAPGFTFKPARTGVPVYSIRGIGFDDFGLGSAPAVSVSVDQVPLPFLIMTPAASLDVERVEILKGPQGTLFGQNTTGGAINFIAAKPTADPHMGFDLSYGRFNDIDAKAYVSGPISGTLRYRVAVDHQYRDAWQISETRPGDRLGRRDFSAGRLLLDWTPTETLTIELNMNGWIDRSESQAAQFVTYAPTIPPGKPSITALIGNRPPAPDDARIADWTPGTDYRRDNRQYQFAVRTDWTASDRVTLTSLTSYAKLNSNTPVDTSGSSFGLFILDQIGSIETFSQELRAAVELGRIKLTVGGNYQHDITHDDFHITFDTSNNQIGPFEWHAFSEEAHQKVDTYALFASTDVPLTSTLTALAGIRYTKQDRSFIGCLRDGGDGNLANGIALVPTLIGLPFNPAPPGGCVTLDDSSPTLDRLPDVSGQLKQDNVSWRLGLNWKPSADTLLYANVTRGFKAGGYSPVPAVYAGQFAPVTQEKVTAYEIGAKVAFLDRKVDLSAALFYNDYRNKQLLGNVLFPIFGALPTLQNIPKAEVEGGEVSLTLRPVKGLTLAGGMTYVRSRVTAPFTVSDPLGNVVANIEGESFPNAPRWQGNANVDYQFEVSAKLKASIGGDVTYRSSTPTDFGGNPYFRIASYALLGLRASIGAPDDSWRVEAWGRNVTDKFYVNSVFKTGEQIARTTGMPASYGVTLHGRF